ncbi:hypothetical protein SKAU_G00288380 [Synaphobranchus kaupii]|uniref:Fibronectin type-III domain-containing protein n=1 Tax=Synaphobranchus kaupii TaxID=118154 RepID=A0A9Q1ETB4_SYNKA|nr:hypothetical protein SKAU_G00288380 [Synaphobranchus kaupii]
MKLLLAVLWASCNDTVFLQACEEKALDNGLTCVTDYWLRISCVLNTTVQPLNRALSHWLVFHDCIEGESKFECQLVNVGDYFNCTTKAEIEGVDTFMADDHFKVTLHSKMSGHEIYMSINSTFWPAYNIKPNAPSNLTVIRNSRTYLFTWISNYEGHPYIREEFDYKLLYYRTGFPDQVNIVHTKGKTLNMSDTILETDTEYTAVVRSHPNTYQGQWSEWSPLVHWRTKAKPVRGWDAFRFVWNVALPMCVVAGILLFFFFSHTDRLKVKVWSIVPTPAPYFQPLYNSYKGNFRSWLLSQGGPGEPLRLEEVVKIDTLMEVQPLKEEEENCPPTPTSHPVPYPTPYVAPGNEGWCTGSHAPSPAPDTPPSLSLLKVSLAEIFGSQSLDLVLAGADEWECENRMHSLDSYWAEDRLTSKPEDLCVRKDYCTLSGPHNELVPAAALTPASAKVDEDPCSGCSHNALGPQADVDSV